MTDEGLIGGEKRFTIVLAGMQWGWLVMQAVREKCDRNDVVVKALELYEAHVRAERWDLLAAIRLANQAAEALHDAKLNEALAIVKMEAVNLVEKVDRLRQENQDLRAAARLRDG